MPDNAEGRPGGGGLRNAHAGGGRTDILASAADIPPSLPALRRQAEHCPLMRAAIRLASPRVLAAIVAFHPPERCAAVRRGGARG